MALQDLIARTTPFKELAAAVAATDMAKRAEDEEKKRAAKAAEDDKKDDDKKDDDKKSKKSRNEDDERGDDDDTKDKDNDHKDSKAEKPKEEPDDDNDKKGKKSKKAENDKDDGPHSLAWHEAYAIARKNERERISSIVFSPAGLRNPEAAWRMALESDMPADHVLAILASFAPAPQGSRKESADSLRERMSNTKQPDIGADADSGEGPTLAEKIILAGRRRRGEIK
jgi:hypothetical protein